MLKVIAEKPAYRPGKKYAYSNVGYTIAGAMAENGDRRNLGRSCETRGF